MKAIVVTDQAAGTAGMKLVERPDPDAARLASLEGANYGDVVVEVHASGFTGMSCMWPSTWVDRLGRDRTPSIPGHEVAGVVTSLGAMALRAVGGTAGVLRLYGRDLRLHPRGIHSRRGTQPRAAAGRRRLHGGRRRRDDGPDRVARAVRSRTPSGRAERPGHGAAGAVGSMATQLAREAGAHVIGTGRDAGWQTAVDSAARVRRPRPRHPGRRRRSRPGVRRPRRQHPEACPRVWFELEERWEPSPARRRRGPRTAWPSTSLSCPIAPN